MSDSIVALITVRVASTRLPNKCLLPFGDATVLEHIVKRCRFFELDPLICTTNNAEDDQLIDIANELNVKFYRGADTNKLLRWKDCCNYYDLDMVHTVDADDPFFCGDEVRRSMKLLNKGYDVIAPTVASSNGEASVGYSLKREIISKACSNTNESTDTEMMWSYIDKVFNLKKSILPAHINGSIDARLTLDYYEDYVLLEAVRLLVGEMATRKDLIELFETNPDLKEINAFRSEEWAANQKSKMIE